MRRMLALYVPTESAIDAYRVMRVFLAVRARPLSHMDLYKNTAAGADQRITIYKLIRIKGIVKTGKGTAAAVVYVVRGDGQIDIQCAS
jgi:hypothetical protein